MCTQRDDKEKQAISKGICISGTTTIFTRMRLVAPPLLPPFTRNRSRDDVDWLLDAAAHIVIIRTCQDDA